MIPRPPKLRIFHRNDQPGGAAAGRRSHAMTFLRRKTARRERQLDGRGRIKDAIEFELNFHFGVAVLRETSVDGQIFDRDGVRSQQSDWSRDPERGDIVRLLIHRAIGALDRIRAMFPIIVYWRPGSDEQFVSLTGAGRRGDVVFVWIDVALVAAEPGTVEPGVGIVVRGAEL